MIVGWSAQSGGTIGNPPVPPVNPRAWVYANGKMVDLNTLLPASCANWTLIVANGVSDNGDIVGVAFVGGYPNGDEHAFLLTPHP
jgi:probable HAF family extracellular repeat protein